MPRVSSPAPPYTKVYDLFGTLGGPIATDRLWYFLGAHTGGTTRNSTNVYYNLNAGDPGTWRYLPDVTRPAYSDRTFESVSGRLTWQMTPRNKVSGFWDAQAVCRSCTGATPGLQEPQQISPEAVGVLGRRLDVTQATWSSPITDRLLLEAGYGGTFFGVGNFEREPNPTRDLVRVVEQCASGCAANGNIPGLAYRSQDFSVAHSRLVPVEGIDVVRHGHPRLKVGYQQTLMTDDRTWMTNNQSLTYRVDNGVPNQLTQSISPWVNNARAGWQAWFVQEQWTLGQLTLQGAVRFDRAWSWFPEQQEGPSRFLPTPIVVPETRGIDSYKDITPRFGIAYDVGRKRHDRDQDEHRQVPGRRRRLGYLRQHQSHIADASDDAGVWHRRRDARMDRRQQQLRPGLRSAEPERTGPPARVAGISAVCCRM